MQAGSHAETPASPSAPAVPAWMAWWTVVVLVLLALYTIADRPLISLQVEPLRKDLGLSDFQVGLIQGVGAALVTAIAAYPIAWLADRFDRRIVLAASIAMWSLSLALASLARSFEELFIASALISIGEAGLVPISIAMIPELFRGTQRHLANSVLLLGGRLGLGLIIALCGWLVLAVDTWRGLLPPPLLEWQTWRLALLALALPGVVLVPLILTLPKAAQVSAYRPGHSMGPAPRPAVWPFLGRHKTAFGSFYLGVALTSLGLGCFFTFAPVVAMRQMGATPLQAGNAMGATTFIATVLGFVIAQVTYRYLTRRFGPAVPARLLVAAAALGAVMAAAALWARTPTELFICMGGLLTAVMAGTLMYPTLLQDLSPTPLRARLVSISVTFNIVLASLGPAMVGALSDHLKPRPDGLLLSMAGVALLAMGISAAALLPMAVRYTRTAADARAEEQYLSRG
jgi:MFS family permease